MIYDNEDEEVDIEIDSTLNSYEATIPDEDLSNRMNLHSASNYMYLLTTEECNRTVESQGHDDH